MFKMVVTNEKDSAQENKFHRQSTKNYIKIPHLKRD